MSDYYDGYREGMKQASRENAALRAHLEAMIESIADLKSITMPPPSICYTMPSEPKKPITEGEILQEWQRHFYEDGWLGFEAGVRFAEKVHGIGGRDE